jgi:uncharacterized transporter YbjL
MHNKKTLFVALGAFFIGFFWALSAQAVCPVCTVAVGAGVGLARYFGVDDTVTGTWIGGLIVSLIMWTFDWFNKKNINFWGKKTLTIILYYVIVAAPLFFTNIIGHPLNKLWGMDKLLLGILVGSLVFLAAVYLYEYLKKKNNNHAHFPYEKVVFPVLALAVVSSIFYFITK